MNDDHRESISRELLTYLGHLPQKLHQNQVDQAELALMLGNCLLWCQHWLQPDGKHIEQPLDETPQSIFALGKQFRAVALRLMDKKRKADTVSAIGECLEPQNQRLDRMEKTILAFMSLDRREK